MFAHVFICCTAWSLDAHCESFAVIYTLSTQSCNKQKQAVHRLWKVATHNSPRPNEAHARIKPGPQQRDHHQPRRLRPSIRDLDRQLRRLRWHLHLHHAGRRAPSLPAAAPSLVVVRANLTAGGLRSVAALAQHSRRRNVEYAVSDRYDGGKAPYTCDDHCWAPRRHLGAGEGVFPQLLKFRMTIFLGQGPDGDSLRGQRSRPPKATEARSSPPSYRMSATGRA